jgi:hypothetical protein
MGSNDIVFFDKKGRELFRIKSNTEFRSYIMEGVGSFKEAPMPKIIKGYESPVYQKYDYEIAAQTAIFNDLPKSDLPKTQGGKSLTGDRPSDLDPTLVKSTIMQETKMGTVNGKAGQNGNSDIMQANVMLFNGLTDWYSGKSAFGLEKGKSATPQESIYAGIRILYTKGLKTTVMRNSRGQIIKYETNWRGNLSNWWDAVRNYNGGGAPNYLQDVQDYFYGAKIPTGSNYHSE